MTFFKNSPLFSPLFFYVFFVVHISSDVVHSLQLGGEGVGLVRWDYTL